MEVSSPKHTWFVLVYGSKRSAYVSTLRKVGLLRRMPTTSPQSAGGGVVGHTTGTRRRDVKNEENPNSSNRHIILISKYYRVIRNISQKMAYFSCSRCHYFWAAMAAQCNAQVYSRSFH